MTVGPCDALLLPPPPANDVCKGYVFTGPCLSTGGHAWWGCAWQGGACVAGGACMAGGHAWWGCAMQGVCVWQSRETPPTFMKLRDKFCSCCLVTPYRNFSNFCLIQWVLQWWSMRKYILKHTQMTNTFDTKIILHTYTS